MNSRAKASRAQVQAQRTKRRPRKVRRAQFPKGVQRSYAKTLTDIGALSKELLRPLRLAIPDMIKSSAESRRFDAGEGDLISQYMAAAKSAMDQEVSPSRIKAIADRVATTTKDWQKRQFTGQIKDYTGVDVFVSDGGQLLFQTEQFLSENVSLIKNLTDKTYFNIETMLQREISEGTTRKIISHQLQVQFDMQARRAKLIARDQIGKYYGKVARARHEAIGVTEFTWWDSGDRRVRPDHVGYSGNDYLYKDAPDGGPGQAVQCRCTGDPVLRFLL